MHKYFYFFFIGLIILFSFYGCSSDDVNEEPSHPFIGIWKNTHLNQNGEWTLNNGDLVYWWEITENTNTSIMQRTNDDGSLCYFIGTENLFEPIYNGEYYTVSSGMGDLIYTIEDGMLVYKTNINSSTYAGMTKDNSISFDPVCND